MIGNPFLNDEPEKKAPAKDRWVDASVTAVSPLKVKLDGYQEVAQSPTKPPLVAGLAVDDRVLCLLQGRQLIVIGKYGG